LFFTTPPLEVEHVKDEKTLGHSVRYLAAKQKREQLLAKRKRDSEQTATEDAQRAKKIKSEAERKFQADVAHLKARALNVLEDRLAAAVIIDMAALSGDGDPGNGLEKGLQVLETKQRVAREAERERAESRKKREEREFVRIEGLTTAL